MEAWLVAIAVMLSGSLATWIFSRFSISTYLLVTMFTNFLLQLVIWVLRVWIVQLAATHWLKRTTSFDQLFRPIAYAQIPAVIGIIPMLGPVLALWSLVTTTVAIRDVTGADSWSAVALTVAGWLGVFVAGYFTAALI
jgi:hypothetical protein